MSSSVRPNPESGLRIRVAPPEVEFVVWPLVQRPLPSILALALAALASLLAGWASGHPGVGLVLAVILGVTLWRTWLPVYYQLSGAGITHRVLGQRRVIPWTAIRRYEVLDRAVLLLPDAAATGLAPLRGLFLDSGPRQQEVIANIDYYLHGWTSRSTIPAQW